MSMNNGLALLCAAGMLAAAGGDLGVLDDEFSDPGRLREWKKFAQVEGWPDRIGKPVPDSVTRFDYVRFRRPVVGEELRKKLEKPAEMTDDDIVGLAGTK
jgi:hypothetical protein